MCLWPLEQSTICLDKELGEGQGTTHYRTTTFLCTQKLDYWVQLYPKISIEHIHIFCTFLHNLCNKVYATGGYTENNVCYYNFIDSNYNCEELLANTRMPVSSLYNLTMIYPAL
jgi:hypothetical protein